MGFDRDFAALLYEYLSTQGLDPVSVLGAPLPAHGQIPAEPWRKMLEHAGRVTGESAFGLRVGASLQLRHLGLIGYLLMSCENAMEALQRAQRFRWLFKGINPLEFGVEGDQLVLSWPLKHGWCGQHIDEMGLASTVRLGRILFGEQANITCVEMVGPEPECLEPYVTVFQCEVLFGQPMPRILIPLNHLTLPVLGADAGLCRLLDAQAEARLQQIMPIDQDMQQLRQQLLYLLRNGNPKISELAALSSLSVRALQRRFTAKGSSFQSFLEETRRHLADEYLLDTRLSLADIAELLGYADQSTFTRAFSAWRGCSPGVWRRAHQIVATEASA